jgi:carbonic anhydrase
MISIFLGLSGGPLDSEYELLQFHAHWGSSNDHGSEHTVDGRAFAAEVKLIKFKKIYFLQRLCKFGLNKPLC